MMDTLWKAPARGRLPAPVRTVLNNLLALGSGVFVARVVNFLMISFVAHQLGPERFGDLSFALALFVAFALIANFGMENLVVREAARHPGVIPRFAGRALVVKLLSLPLGLAIVAFVVARDPRLSAIAFWLFLYGQMRADLLFLCAIFRGMERMGRVAILISLEALLIAGGALLGLRVTAEPLTVAVAHGTGALLALLLAWLWLLREVGRPEIHWEPREWWALARLNGPFTLAMAGLLLFDRQAVLFIEWLGERSVLGWFNAVYLLILALAALPIVMTNAATPMLAQRAQRGEPVLPVARALLKGALAAGAGLGAALFLAAPWLVPLLYGEAFRPAVAMLRALSVALPAVFAIIVLNGILQMLDAQRAAAGAFLLALLAGLPLSAHLTMTYGSSGAVAGYVLSALLLASALALAARRVARGYERPVAP